MTELEDGVSKLVESIKKFDEYKSFSEAKKAYEHHERAQNLLARARELENKIEASNHKGEEHEDNESLHKEYEQVQNKLSNIDVVQEYYDAEEDLEDELEEVNGRISEELEIDFARSVAFE